MSATIVIKTLTLFSAATKMVVPDSQNGSKISFLLPQFLVNADGGR